MGMGEKIVTENIRIAKIFWRKHTTDVGIKDKCTMEQLIPELQRSVDTETTWCLVPSFMYF